MTSPFVGIWTTRRYSGVDGNFEDIELTITKEDDYTLDGHYARGQMDAQMIGKLSDHDQFWSGDYQVPATGGNGATAEVGQFTFRLENNDLMIVGSWQQKGSTVFPSYLWIGYPKPPAPARQGSG